MSYSSQLFLIIGVIYLLMILNLCKWSLIKFRLQIITLGIKYCLNGLIYSHKDNYGYNL